MINNVKFIKENTNISISVCGGGKETHIISQIRPIFDYLDYIFCENGTQVFIKDKLIEQKDLKKYIPEKHLQIVINNILLFLSELDLPFKRGTFIELRNGLINVSPVGRNCTLEERHLFSDYDKKHKVLQQLKDFIESVIEKEGIDLIVTFGGKISLDIFPSSWQKSLCLEYIDTDKYNVIFFGDKIMPGGNDYSVAIDKRVIGYFKIKHVEDTDNIMTCICNLLKDLHKNRTSQDCNISDNSENNGNRELFVLMINKGIVINK